ncbi:MAG: hypothetical protein KDE51_11920, partial [Anaerolineales bacterium]|nr:hypothetical protein [Anaerolineales bacterium]
CSICFFMQHATQSKTPSDHKEPDLFIPMFSAAVYTAQARHFIYSRYYHVKFLEMVPGEPHHRPLIFQHTGGTSDAL